MKRSTIALCILSLMLVGCQGFGWLGEGAAGGKKKINVDARYLGLDNQSVAVLVSADQYILAQYPNVDLAVCSAVTRKIASNVPGVTVTNPTQVMTFQKNNPYWSTLPYEELIARLGTQRVVLIDLIEYRTHEPGNAHVWQGLISANVGVIEADAADPDRMAINEIVSVKFPENSDIGMLNSDDQTVELGMLSLFSRDAAGLFYDHKIEVEK
ncbi:MAG: hypothetical protein IT445_11485 [Phycisphaeraceae bacterium]|nr:hypothetical protein [Phycisphaeraceae bacterium]